MYAESDVCVSSTFKMFFFFFFLINFNAWFLITVSLFDYLELIFWSIFWKFNKYEWVSSKIDSFWLKHATIDTRHVIIVMYLQPYSVPAWSSKLIVFVMFWMLNNYKYINKVLSCHKLLDIMIVIIKVWLCVCLSIEILTQL